MRLVLVAMLVAVGLIAAAWTLLRADPTPALRVGVMEWPGFYPLMAGAVDGSLTGIQVVAYADNPSLNAALRRREVDAVVGAACDAALLCSQGTDARIIAVLDTSDGADVILARPGVTRLGETPDQRISFEGVNSFSHLFVLDSLERAGVPEVSVRCQDLAAAAVPQALLEGRLDAGHTWGPLAEAARAKGCTVLVRAGDHPGVVTDVLMTRQDVLDRRPVELRRLIQGIFTVVESYRTREADLIARAGSFLRKPAAELSPVTGSVRICDQRASLRAMMDHGDPAGVRLRLHALLQALARRGQMPRNLVLEDLLVPDLLNP